MAYQLKILAGANEGAVCRLSGGQYVIGADEDCDLILADPQVRDRHVTVSVEDADVGLTAMAVPVWYGGQPLDEGETIALEAFEPFRIGTSVMAVGGDDAEWPAIDTDTILQIGRAGTAVEEPEDEAAEGSADVADNGDGEHPGPDAEAPQAADGGGATEPAEPAGGPAPSPAHHGGGASLTLAVIVALLAFLGLGATAYLVLATPGMHRMAEPMAPDPLIAVRSILAELPGMENVRAVRKPGGRIDIEGTVENRQQVATIRDRLRNLANRPQTSLRVQPMDELRRSVTGILAQLNARLEVSIVDGGRAVGIKGFLPSDDALDSLKLLFDRDLPGAPVDYEGILTMNRIAEAVRAQLDDAGLGHAVKTETAGKDLRLVGRIADAGAKAQLATVVKVAKRTYGGFVGIEDRTTVPMSGPMSGPHAADGPDTAGGPGMKTVHVGKVPEPRKPVDMAMPGGSPGSRPEMTSAGKPMRAAINVRTGPPTMVFHVVVVGDQKFVKDSNGNRYGLGDKLLDGFVVVSIERDMIIAEKDGNPRRIKIGP